MARFYFDVREGAKFIPDEEGLEFDSLDAAEYEASRAATEMVTVELRNEHRQRVLTVKVSMEIDRVDPAPEPPRVR